MERRDSITEAFVLRMQELRGSRTNADFARDIGLSRPTMGFYMNGQRLPDMPNLKIIAEACGVSTDYLLGLTNVKSRDVEQRYVCEYTGLSEKSVESIIKQSHAADRLLSAETIDKFLRVFADVGKCVQMVNNSLSVAKALMEVGTLQSQDGNEEGLMMLINDSRKSLRLAVFEFAEESKRLVESVFNTYNVIEEAKFVYDELKERYDNAE